MKNTAFKRCDWANIDPLLRSYHDIEWGTPVREDNLLFEFLILEGAQAGLSWLTILKKRENYRKAFDDFEPRKIAKYDNEKVNELLQNAGIIRNRLKISATVQNAKSLLAVKEEFGSFANFVWGFVPDHKPIAKGWRSIGQVPASTKESNEMSRDMIKRGFRFVGPTICYSFMQATGLVNDHVSKCFRFSELKRGKN